VRSELRNAMDLVREYDAWHPLWVVCMSACLCIARPEVHVAPMGHGGPMVCVVLAFIANFRLGLV